jgi:hypothetical protein
MIQNDDIAHRTRVKLSPLQFARPDKNDLAALRLWLTAPFELQRPEGVSFHRFFHQFERVDADPIDALPRVFLIMHDWGAAFAGDRDFDDHASEFRLPAPKCAFDFAISGRRVVAFVGDHEPEKISAVIEWRPFWFPLLFWKQDNLQQFYIDGPQERAGVERLRTLLLTNIKAACVSLEAQIAELEIVRAPHKLNAARARRGKSAIPDYRVINLMQRRRAKLPLDQSEHSHRGLRLHFRRGHWRHFVSHKTWIKWTLVGDPDLGFIDKEYRL